MSYNISNSVMSHLTRLDATVDVSTFGPSQKRKLYNYARTGIIKGGGVPSDIAKSMRENAGMPFINIRRNSLTAGNIYQEDVYTKILGALAMIRIQNECRVSDPYIFAKEKGHVSGGRYRDTEEFIQHKPKDFYVYQTNIGQYFHYKSLDEMEVNLNEPIVVNFINMEK